MKHVLAILLFCTSVGLPAQGLVIDACGGAIGKTVTYDIRGGQPNQRFILVSSLRRASIPLRWIDPNEQRTLRVGLDLPQLLLYLRFDANGRFKASFPLVNDPGLVGKVVLHQAVSYPGKGSVLDQFSDVVVVPFGVGGAFKQQTSKMSSARAFATCIPLRDGKELIVGGGGGTLLWQTPLKTTEIFDPATHSFAAGPSMNVGRSSHTQTRLDDGRYLLTGGVATGNTPQTSCELFDPKTGKFTAAASMRFKRTMHTATLLPDGRVIVVGGIQDMSTGQNAVTSQLRDTEVYDPKTNRWSAGGRMSTPRGAHGAIDMGKGRILIVGGLSFTSIFSFKSPNIQRSCEIYDAATNRMSRTGAMATSRALAGHFLLPDGKVMVAGGLTGNITAGGIATEKCEIYDPATSRWSSATSLATKSAGAGSMRLRDGRFAMIGGGRNTIYTPTPNAVGEAYDVTTRKWLLLPALQAGRMAGTVVELQACGMVVLGGGTTSSATSVATWEMLVR